MWKTSPRVKSRASGLLTGGLLLAGGGAEEDAAWPAAPALPAAPYVLGGGAPPLAPAAPDEALVEYSSAAQVGIQAQGRFGIRAQDQDQG